MKFKNIKIKNFRNFEDIDITLDNRNVFFGMNDIGKTNFLYALRYLFDKEIRKNNFTDTDFYRKKTEFPIEITVSIDISDENDVDNEKLRAKVKGAILSNQNTVYIRLIARYVKQDMSANIMLYWGGDPEDLQEMKSKGYMFDIDYVFNVFYIDSYVNMYNLFKKNISVLLDNNDDTDKSRLSDIDKLFKKLNDNISSLSGIKKFEQEINSEYNEFQPDRIQISIKSEISINGLFSSVTPYIKQEDKDELYPTAGEGRKKILVYSIYDILAVKKNDTKINIFLIEEPENHLHRTMQMSLSKQIFGDKRYRYSFITTHSSSVLMDMDNVNLVRIFNESKIDSASSFYKVPKNFSEQKHRLNKELSEAVFADKVLLVEGPSEEILFDKVLSSVESSYWIKGFYILPVGGIGFKPYLDILKQLKIPCFVKTDNDLRKNDKSEEYIPIGFRRINRLIGEEVLPVNSISGNNMDSKLKLYNDNKKKLDEIREKYHIYLSKVSLEEDLDEVLHDELIKYLPEAHGDVVSYLCSAKKYNMIGLVNQLSHEDCRKIIEHYNFACLQDFIGQ